MMNPVPTVRETRSRAAARRGPSTLPPISKDADETGCVPTDEIATMLGLTRLATWAKRACSPESSTVLAVATGAVGLAFSWLAAQPMWPLQAATASVPHAIPSNPLQYFISTYSPSICMYHRHGWGDPTPTMHSAARPSTTTELSHGRTLRLFAACRSTAECKYAQILDQIGRNSHSAMHQLRQLRQTAGFSHANVMHTTASILSAETDAPGSTFRTRRWPPYGTPAAPDCPQRQRILQSAAP